MIDAAAIIEKKECEKPEFWIPTNSLDEKKLIIVLTKMVRHYLMTSEAHELFDLHIEINEEMDAKEEKLEPQEQLQLAA